MEQIIKIVLAVIFGLAAVAKISGKSKSTFQKSGYGLPFMYVTAFAEILFSVGLFTQYDFWAAIGMLAITVGAIGTLILQRATIAKYGMALLSLILLLAFLIISKG